MTRGIATFEDQPQPDPTSIVEFTGRWPALEKPVARPLAPRLSVRRAFHLRYAFFLVGGACEPPSGTGQTALGDRAILLLLNSDMETILEWVLMFSLTMSGLCMMALIVMLVVRRWQHAGRQREKAVQRRL